MTRHSEVATEPKTRPARKGDRVKKDSRSVSPPEQYRRDRHSSTASSSKRNHSPTHKESRDRRHASPHRDSREHRHTSPRSRTSRERHRHSSPSHRESRMQRHSPPPRHRHSHHRSRSPHDRHPSRSPEPAGNSSTQGASNTKPVRPPPQPVWSDDANLTPEQKLEQALAAARALGPKLTPVPQPSPVNPTSNFQSVMEKRKLLWKKGKKQAEKSWNNWEVASFEGDERGQAQSKFRRLMGIKNSSDLPENVEAADKMKKESTHLLDELEKQYELSRFKTHMARGVGLGYGSDTLPKIPSTSTGTDDLLESNH